MNLDQRITSKPRSKQLQMEFAIAKQTQFIAERERTLAIAALAKLLIEAAGASARSEVHDETA